MMPILALVLSNGYISQEPSSVYINMYNEVKCLRSKEHYMSPYAYSTLPALAGIVVSMELVAAEAAAMFLPSKLVKKLVVL